MVDESTAAAPSKGRKKVAPGVSSVASAGKAHAGEDQNAAPDESQEYFDVPSQLSDKAKGKQRAIETPPSDRNIFRLMDLPPELRLEIYRACLTRPWNIRLSKPEPPPAPKEDQQDEETIQIDANGNIVNNYERYKRYQLAHCAGPLAVQRRMFGAISGHGGLVRQAPQIVIRAMIIGRAVPSVPAGSSNQATTSSCTLALNSARAGPSTATKSGPTRPVKNYASPDDPLVINLLRCSQEIYKEARDVMYSENVFELSVADGTYSMSALHQRSRRVIKHIHLKIPTYTEILERFSEIVRLSLRYCYGLQQFVIHTPFKLPGDGHGSMNNSNTTVYANGFDILRWLPQTCKVVMTGTANSEIDAVVEKHANLAKVQNKVSYDLRQAHPELFNH